VNPTRAQTVTFRLYGPTDPACVSVPVFTSVVPLAGGSAQSGTYTPIAAGTYRWIATYDGDANNSPVSGRCGDPTETRTVDQPPATLPPTGATPVDTASIALAAIAAGSLLRKVRRLV
jgi:hypothetical protein